MTLNGLSLVSLALLISAFLRDSKVASQIGMFVVYLPCSIFLGLFITVTIQNFIQAVNTDDLNAALGDYWPTKAFQIGYILPHFSFGIVFLEFLTKGGASLLGYNVALAWISLIL